MAQDVGDELDRAVENTADRLQVSADNVWKMINTGDLSIQETPDGQWTIPDWSVDYILAARSREARADSKPKIVPVSPQPVPEPPSSKESKRIDLAKKWKRKFDELGRRKNDLVREKQELLRGRDRNARRLPTLDVELRESLRDLEAHVRAGLEAGFAHAIDMSTRKKGKRKKAPGAGLKPEEMGLRVGLPFSREVEVLNTFDPRRELEVWERPVGAETGSFQSPGT